MSTVRYISIVLFLYVLLSIAISQTDEHHEDDHDDHTTDKAIVWRAIGITTFAGFAAFIGAFSIFCVKKDQIGIMSASLSFSAGVTIHLSFVNLIPECIELLSRQTTITLAHFYTLLCVIGGIVIGLLMELLFKYFDVDPHQHHHTDPNSIETNSSSTHKSNKTSAENANNNNKSGELHTTHTDVELQDITEAKPLKISPNLTPTDTTDPHVQNQLNLSQTSYSVAFALILHHFPEGIATFVSLYHDLHFGILVAFALALHDIPSGICISVPIYCATGSKVKPFCLCAVAAVVYPIGAFIGWIIIETTSDAFIDVFIAILVGLTAGIMLYISFVELLPTAIISANRYSSSKSKSNQSHKNILNVSLILLFAGFLLMSVSNILLIYVGGHNH